MCKPTKLTPQVHDALCRSIALGTTMKTAAQAAGITPQCLWLWEQKAKEGEQPYLGLIEDLKKAEAERINTWLSQIETAAQQGTWTAAAWKLERLGGPEFAPPTHKVELDARVELDVSSLSDEELDHYIDSRGTDIPARLGPGRERTPSPAEAETLAS